MTEGKTEDPALRQRMTLNCWSLSQTYGKNFWSLENSGERRGCVHLLRIKHEKLCLHPYSGFPAVHSFLSKDT